MALTALEIKDKTFGVGDLEGMMNEVEEFLDTLFAIMNLVRQEAKFKLWKNA